jgi:hypothetical protein
MVGKRWRRPPGVSRRGENALAGYVRYRRGVRAGQLVMMVAVGVALVHMVAHFGGFSAQPTGWEDLLVGYPAAGLLFLGGAYLAGRNPPK